ncbi:CBO0543 family protein [Bacillus sp. MRMR6]|uniref:CBO0543 family protein n=1 Tax=Bacillus sp. MRMR6 TaxID=1928617 RepID=UPI00095166B9|nr:CBO0543 family protein [Bacillus sp. MRMR6]OLS39940.1 hypothetical protein BTR25_12060 [Bacillus sp. MRMR6]
MNTVKRLKDLNLQPWPRKSSRSWIKEYTPAVMLAGLGSTALDLYHIDKNLYMFPNRPFPELFSINIVFTFGILPILIFVFLYLMQQVSKWGRAGIILFLSLVMPVAERFFELLGYFEHNDHWQHINTFFWYLILFAFCYTIFLWNNKEYKKAKT